MKKDKALWGSISILVGIVIAILALVRGDMQTWLLLGVFSLWGSWIIVILLLPYMRPVSYTHLDVYKRQGYAWYPLGQGPS